MGAGWALVGDAGCHKDPFLALGVCDALRDAELLADALADGFAGRQPFEAALADYEARRNRATLADYQENLAARAQFPPVEQQVLQLRRALRENPEQTRQFYLAFERRIPPKSFFNPENIAKIVGRGAGSRAAASELSEKT